MIAQLLVNGLVAGLSWAMIALGFALIHGTVRFLPGAHGAMVVFGAYVVITLERYGAPLVAGVLAATAATALLGLAAYHAVTLPLRDRGCSPLVLFLASLAIAVVVESLITVSFGSDIQVLRRGPDTRVLALGAARVTQWQAVTAICGLLIFLLAWTFLRFTLWGKSIRAISDDAELAEIVGIPKSLLSLTLAAGSGLAGFGGAFMVRESAVTPEMGFVFLLGSAAATIVGGGSIRGAVIGGGVLGVSQHLSVLIVPAQWQDSVVSTMLLLCLALGASSLGPGARTRGRPTWST